MLGGLKCRLSFSSNVNSESAKEEYRKASRNVAVPEVLDDLLCRSAIVNHFLTIIVQNQTWIWDLTIGIVGYVLYYLSVRRSIISSF